MIRCKLKALDIYLTNQKGANMATAKNKTHKIYSQASNDVVIPNYKKKDEKGGEKKTQSYNEIESAVIIKGGANVRDKHHGMSKWAVTEVNADELVALKAHKGFMRRVKRGFITIDEEPVEFKSDKSAQLTEKQVKAKTKAEVKTGPVESED